jgi:hypothetical protein
MRFVGSLLLKKLPAPEDLPRFTRGFFCGAMSSRGGKRQRIIFTKAGGIVPRDRRRTGEARKGRASGALAR